MLTTTRVPCARFGQYVPGSCTICDRHLSWRRWTKQMMQTTRYGCDLAGVLQTHPDLGPAWLLIYENSAAFLRGYDSGGRVCRAWPSTTPNPLRSSLRRTGRRRLTLLGGVSWGLDTHGLAGSPVAHAGPLPNRDRPGEFPATGREPDQV